MEKQMQQQQHQQTLTKAQQLTRGIPFKLTASLLCVALAAALSAIFHFGNLPGDMFLPMHIPIIACGFVCGHKYGGVAGFVTPFISHFITGMPIASPVPVVYFMAFEMAAYGFFAGLFCVIFFKARQKKIESADETAADSLENTRCDKIKSKRMQSSHDKNLEKVINATAVQAIDCDKIKPKRMQSSHDFFVEMSIILGALVISLLLGRIAFGTASFIFWGAGDFDWTRFLRSMFVTSLPGAIIQIISLPILVQCLRHNKVIE